MAEQAPSTQSPGPHPATRRPRGGQWWRHRETGDCVWVNARRTVNPMEGVRLHSDMRWSLVFYSVPEKSFGMAHETDFVKEYEFHA